MTFTAMELVYAAPVEYPHTIPEVLWWGLLLGGLQRTAYHLEDLPKEQNQFNRKEPKNLRIFSTIARFLREEEKKGKKGRTISMWGS